MLKTEMLPQKERRQVPVSAELAEEARKWDKPPKEAKPERPTRAESGPRSVRFDLD